VWQRQSAVDEIDIPVSVDVREAKDVADVATVVFPRAAAAEGAPARQAYIPPHLRAADDVPVDEIRSLVAIEVADQKDVASIARVAIPDGIATERRAG